MCKGPEKRCYSRTLPMMIGRAMLAASLLGVMSCGHAEKAPTESYVLTFSGGHNDLTWQFFETVRTNFDASGAFSKVDVPRVIKVHVAGIFWDPPNKIRFEVKFYEAGPERYLGEASGTCPRSDLETCAKKLLNETKKVRW